MIKLPVKTSVYLMLTGVMSLIILLSKVMFNMRTGTTTTVQEWLILAGASFIGCIFIVGVIGMTVNLINQFIGGKLSERIIIIICLMLTILFFLPELINDFTK